MKKIVVEWLDITKKTNDDEFNKYTSPDDLLSKMKTIGWLYKETVDTILLVQEFDEGTPRDWIAIPKALIVKVEVLGEEDGKEKEGDIPKIS